MELMDESCSEVLVDVFCTSLLSDRIGNRKSPMKSGIKSTFIDCKRLCSAPKCITPDVKPDIPQAERSSAMCQLIASVSPRSVG